MNNGNMRASKRSRVHRQHHTFVISFGDGMDVPGTITSPYSRQPYQAANQSTRSTDRSILEVR